MLENGSQDSHRSRMEGLSSLRKSVLIGLLLVAFNVVKGDDYLSIAHSPSYVKFDNSNADISLSEVEKVLEALFGFTNHQDLKYAGLGALNPYELPSSAVLLSLYGGDNYMQQSQGHKVNLKVDDVHVTLSALKHRLNQVYSHQVQVIELNHNSQPGDLSGLLMGMDGSKQVANKLVGDLRPGTVLVNSTDPQVERLLTQVSLVLQTLARISQPIEADQPGPADFYSFELELPVIGDEAVNGEVNALVTSLSDKIEQVMREIYGEDYVSLVLSLPKDSIKLSRKARSLLAEKTPAESSTMDDLIAKAGVADEWTEDYPVIFHIILWLTVFMALLVIFVTVGMMSMDPGTDSIIYRMTTTRMKKD